MLKKSMENTEFDGVICFGGVDWWYHNRGHYDLQMMREFSQKYPVLYVNSIGMRPPKIGEGAMFVTRIKRKLKSLFRGLVKVRNNFSVFSPVTLPGGGNGPFSAWVAKTALVMQVKIAAWRCGIRRPLVWVACPPGLVAVPHLKSQAVIYQRTDRFEDFAGVNSKRIKEFDTELKKIADIVLFCSRELYQAEKQQNSGSLFVDHGVDFSHFEKAGIAYEKNGKEPPDLSGIPHPRVGFIGGIDAHTFDPELFVNVVSGLPDVSFVMIGACSLPDNWCPYENVYLLGQRPYEEVASYMAACDVLIMPWNQSDWIKACNPVKMKEYLAVGKPIVSTYFPEVDFFREHIHVASNANEFQDMIKSCLANSEEPLEKRAFVQDHTWSAKADVVLGALKNSG
ncbi:glycosyltransferase [Sneathiella glossodoripedis]|uniref:glycosyltransferase n=1 Tax=Sneathiella glossodoripedis TaxID=418853 RepID=UPI00056D7896|nr:glycosyltransferase [Sneathiella glossodoripedis]